MWVGPCLYNSDSYSYSFYHSLMKLEYIHFFHYHVRLKVLVLDPQLTPLPRGSTWSVLVESTGSLCDGLWVHKFLFCYFCLNNATTNLQLDNFLHFQWSWQFLQVQTHALPVTQQERQPSRVIVRVRTMEVQGPSIDTFFECFQNWMWWIVNTRVRAPNILELHRCFKNSTDCKN